MRVRPVKPVFMAAGGVAGGDYLRGVLFMSDLRKAAQELIATSESCDIDRGTGSWAPDDAWSALVDALEDAPAQPDPAEVRQGWEYMRAKGLLQEPVAWVNEHGHIDRGLDAILEPTGWTPLYTAPPQRKPLTDEEMDKLFGYETERGAVPGHFAVAFVRIVERAHGIGGEE